MPARASPGEAAQLIDRYDQATYSANAARATAAGRDSRIERSPRAITTPPSSASRTSAPQYQVSAS